MGSSSKAPEVKESQAEKALADVSSQKWDRYKELYRPVESEYINNVSKDRSQLLKGRNIADVNQASEGAFGNAVALGNGGAGQLGAAVSNMGAARVLGAAGGYRAAQERKDVGQLNALKIGNNMAADAQGGLAMAARASNTEALGRARAQSIENDGKSQMLGAVLGAAGTYGADKWGGSAAKPGMTPRSSLYIPSSSADRRGLTNRDGAW